MVCRPLPRKESPPGTHPEETARRERQMEPAQLAPAPTLEREASIFVERLTGIGIQKRMNP